MTNDADQKPKWEVRRNELADRAASATSKDKETVRHYTKYGYDAAYADALAEIESLRAENEKLHSDIHLLTKLNNPSVVYIKEEGNAYYQQCFKENTAEIESLRAENAELKFRIEQKSMEIGRAEHRGNTVDYIYDKCANYGEQFHKLNAKLSAAAAENAELNEKLASNVCGYCWDKMHEDKIDELQTKLTAAAAQLEKMAEALVQIRLMFCMHSEGGSEDLGQAKAKANEAMHQYEQFKKGLLK